MELKIQAHPVIPGEAQGDALVSQEPISFWGGYDKNTGEIIDRRHPLSGQNAAGRVLVIPFSRGSSTGAAILLEAIKQDKAPAAILTTGIDTFFALASIVADEMYQSSIPIIALTPEDFAQLKTGQHIHIHPDGSLLITTQ